MQFTPPLSEEDLRERLEKAGILPTRQRMKIARVTLERRRHLSADQVLALVIGDGDRISKATVYNTLGLFARKGLVREVLVDPNKIFFDSNTGDHFHLYNEDTGALTDIYADCLREDALPELPADTELVDIDLVIRVRNVSKT